MGKSPPLHEDPVMGKPRLKAGLLRKEKTEIERLLILRVPRALSSRE
jgi:hypothetical protein